MNTLNLAWRNLWRNRRRTLITASSLGLGVGVLVFSLAFIDGMYQRVVKVGTQSRIGHAQVHVEGYRETQDERKVLADPNTILEQARGLPGIKAATARLYGSGLLAVGDRARGVQLIGIDPSTEPQVTHWHQRLVEGRMLEAANEVVIGAWMAQRMEVEVDTRMVMTVANVDSGEAQVESVRVVGFLATGDALLDKRSVILNGNMLGRLMGLGEARHEISLMVDVPVRDRAAIEAAIAPLKAPGLSVLPWQEINRMVAQGLKLQSYFFSIFVGIIFFILSFGIINTIAMSLAERRHEFGVLRALGTTPGRLAGLILSEAGWLGIVGALPGVLLGIGLTVWLGKVGISLGATSAYGVTFVDPLYPQVDWVLAFRIGLLFTGLTVLTAGFSAWRAARTLPVDAMRA